MKLLCNLFLSVTLVLTLLSSSSHGTDWMFKRSNYSYSKGLHGANRFARAPNTKGVILRRGYRYDAGITEIWVQWVTF